MNLTFPAEKSRRNLARGEGIESTYIGQVVKYKYSLVSNRRHALNKHNTGPFSTFLIKITYLISVIVALKSKF